MKVMHVRATNFFGGPEKQIIEHLRLLQATEVRPFLVSFYEKGRETELASRARALGVPVSSLPCLSAYDPMQLVRLRTLFSAERPELICSHDYRSTFISSIARAGLPARQIAFWRGITRENPKVALYYKIESRLLGKMDHVVVVSREQQRLLISRGLPSRKVSLVPNAVRVTGPHGDEQAVRLAELFNGLRGRKIIATAGRLSPEKGHKYLIGAMQSVTADMKDAVLLIFGEGPLRRELMQLAERLRCADSIYFLGFVPEFSSFLREIDLFVLSSLAEGLPNALLEALAAAKPVVATSVGGVPEIVTDGQTGILVSPGDSVGLARAITKVLCDPALANSMGQAGREAVRKSYSFEEQLRLLAQVYEKTLGRAGSSGCEGVACTDTR